MEAKDFTWDFFLAHASHDKTAAEALYHILEPYSKVYLDSQCLLPGDDWDFEISAAQAASLITVVLISSHTNKAYYQREEIATAIDMARRDKCKHRVVPIYLDVSPTDDRIPYGLRLKYGLSVKDIDNLAGVSNRLMELLGKLKSQKFGNCHAEILEKSVNSYVQSTLSWKRLCDFDRFQLPLMAKCNSVCHPLSDILKKQSRLVITGDPGSGKTVFLLRNLKSFCLSFNKSTGGAKTINKVNENDLLPIYIEIGMLAQVETAAFNNRQMIDRLLHLVISQIFPYHKDKPLHNLINILDKYRMLLLLDGLNELPKDYQFNFTSDLFSFDQKLRQLNKQASMQIVLTSRIYGFNNVFESEGWTLAEILPLEPEAIQEELTKKILNVITSRKDFFRRIDVRIRQMLSNPQHLDFVIEWLQDSIKDGFDIEDSIRTKGLLLRYCAEKKLSKLDENKIPIVEAILCQLSYLNICGGTFFAYSDVLSVVAQTLRFFNSSILPESLLEEIFNIGILVKSKKRVRLLATPQKKEHYILAAEYTCRFVHHSVQQYFAACSMKYHWELGKYLHNERYHEPLIIMAGILEDEQLFYLLKKIKSNPRLYAYAMANIYKPELENDFLNTTINRFIKLVKRWSTNLSLVLTHIFLLWFLGIPLVAYFYTTYYTHIQSQIMQVVFSFLGLGYVFIIPVLLIRWHNKRFMYMKKRLSNHELPNVIVILRYLMARGAMLKIRSKLIELNDKIKYHDEDPRKAFVNEVIAAVSQAVSNSSYLTEDEMLERLSDPLVAAAIDQKNISKNGIHTLLCKAKNPYDDQSGLAAMDILKELYMLNHECSQEIAQAFIIIAQNVYRIYSQRRCRHAIRICRKTGLTLQPKVSWVWQLICRFFFYLKELWLRIRHIVD